MYCRAPLVRCPCTALSSHMCSLSFSANLAHAHHFAFVPSPQPTHVRTHISTHKHKHMCTCMKVHALARTCTLTNSTPTNPSSTNHTHKSHLYDSRIKKSHANNSRSLTRIPHTQPPHSYSHQPHSHISHFSPLLPLTYLPLIPSRLLERRRLHLMVEIAKLLVLKQQAECVGSGAAFSRERWDSKCSLEPKAKLRAKRVGAEPNAELAMSSRDTSGFNLALTAKLRNWG